MAEINLDSIPSNSYKSREAAEQKDIPRRKLSAVGDGRSKAMKEPVLKRLKKTFIDDDFTPSNLKTFVVKDVIAPAIQNAILDGVNGALEMMFGIGIVRRGYRSSSVISSRTPYRSSGNTRTVGNGSSSVSSKSQSSERRGRSSFEVQMKDNKADAEKIMMDLEALLEEQPDAGVTVSDYYDAFGITTEFTDNNYGWYNLDGMRLKQVPKAFVDEETGRYINGWAVIMPPEQAL